MADSDNTRAETVETLRRERDDLLRLASNLKTGMGLRLIRDIHFDPASGALSFTEDEADPANRHAGEQVTHQLDDDETERLIHLNDCSNVAIELTFPGSPPEYHKLTLTQCIGGTHWQSGALTRITETAKVMQALAAKTRLSELGEQAAILHHELRQPLFTISTAMENLRLILEKNGSLSDAAEQRIDRVAQQLDRAQILIKRSLDYASTADNAPSSCQLDHALDKAIDFLEALFERLDITVTRGEVPRDLQVELSEINAQQIFVNLLRNAADSIKSRRDQGWSGPGEIAARFDVAASQITCTICDNGAGLEPNASGSVFQPFFTTKANEGTGLGLYICQQILAAAKGKITLTSALSQGACAVLTLPVILEP